MAACLHLCLSSCRPLLSKKNWAVCFESKSQMTSEGQVRFCICSSKRLLQDFVPLQHLYLQGCSLQAFKVGTYPVFVNHCVIRMHIMVLRAWQEQTVLFLPYHHHFFLFFFCAEMRFLPSFSLFIVPFDLYSLLFCIKKVRHKIFIIFVRRKRECKEKNVRKLFFIVLTKKQCQ